MADDLDEAGDLQPEERLRRLQEQVQGEEERLGPRLFEEEAGRFWRLPEARPYLEARTRLSMALWNAGRSGEAAAHALDLLRLDEEDRHSVRIALAQMLVEEGRLDEAADLLARFEARDARSAWWAYTRLLLAIRRGEAEAGKLLLEALSCNPHVLECLLDPTLASSGVPTSYARGDHREAEFYAHLARANWHEEGASALRWVAEAGRAPETVRREERPGRNDPCWCGSGKKYKKCHLAADAN